jgi:DNA-directed RNA polymerase subunit RPC12/RpoP
MTTEPQPHRRRVNKWRTEYRCVSCQHRVSHHEKMYSHGRCPYCGFKGAHAGSIMYVTEHAYRLVRYGKWWQFWVRPVREYKQ